MSWFKKTLFIFGIILIFSACSLTTSNTINKSSVSNDPTNVDESGNQNSDIEPPLPPQPTPVSPTTSANTPTPFYAEDYVFVYITNTPQKAFYGACTTEETIVNVQVSVEPLDQISSVTLQYIFQINDQIYSDWVNLPMSQIGIGDYVADIDVGNNAGGLLVSSAGYATYSIVVEDLNGNEKYSDFFFIDIEFCGTAGSGGAVDPVPAPTPTPDSAVGIPVSFPIIYTFDGPTTANEGDSIYISWTTADANCGVWFDGVPVLENGGEYYAIPNGSSGGSINLYLEASGGDCNNPNTVASDFDVFIDTNQTTVNKLIGNLIQGDTIDLDGNGGAGEAMLDETFDGHPYFGQFGGGGTNFHGWTATYEPSIGECETAAKTNGTIGAILLDAFDYICYRTDEGNYGYFAIDYLVLDLNNGKWVLEISAQTEIKP